MLVDLLRKILVFILLVAFVQAQTKEEWMASGHKAVQDALKICPNMGIAKNVVFFLGDGMGVSTVTAARILKGQLEKQTGEEYQLEMEKLPFSGLIKTYNTNQQTPDSAGTATAFLTGVKTRAGVLGVDHSVAKGDCTNLKTGSLNTIVDWALAEGKSVGLVSTARITHATPGAAYAKIPHRDWESDADIKNATNCENSGLEDIALQLVKNHAKIHVLLGGGRRNFHNDTATGGKRLDGRNLIQEWKDSQENLKRKHIYVTNNDDFKKVDAENVDSVLGLFNPSHLNYEVERVKDGPTSEPSLSEMTVKAINILRKNDKGFFLLVEGGRIDHGHHGNLAKKALTETIALDEALKASMKLTSEADTLTMVTADHSHVFNIAGYPERGHDILSIMDNSNEASWYAPLDGRAMTTVIYGNGPGPNRSLDLTTVDTTDKDFLFPNAVPISYETHGGEDVAVFARGPMSHLVGGVSEQNVLAHIMGYAACMGPDKSHCDDPSASACYINSAVNPLAGVLTVLVTLTLTMILV